MRIPLMLLHTLCLLALAATPLTAAPKAGDAAPQFKLKGNVVNPVEHTQLSEMQGDVVLIKEWQIRDIGSAKELPTIQKYWTERGGKGLHAFLIHRLNFEKYHDVIDYCQDKGYTFCVPMGGFYDTNDFDAYRADSKEFRTTVIGVDGKVAFHGTTGWEPVLEAELKKCVYPGLTKHSVHKLVEKAAGFFAQRSYGKALVEAQKLSGHADDAVKGDAALLIERAEGFHKALRSRIDKAREERRWQLALELLDRVVEEFRLHEYGTQAAAEAKALRDDKSLKSELKSWEAFKKVLDENRKRKDRNARATALRAFARAHTGLRAAEDAEKLAKELEQSLEE